MAGITRILEAIDKGDPHAAEAMRRILIEQARRKKRLRHGGARRRVELYVELLGNVDRNDRLIELDKAL